MGPIRAKKTTKKLDLILSGIKNRPMTQVTNRASRSQFTPFLIQTILTEIANGGKLTDIAKRNGFTYDSWFHYMEHHPEVRQQYARARILQCEVMADEILTIADDASRDTIEGENGPMQNNEWIARSRVRIDVRKWLLAKINPARWGEKIEMEHSGQITHGVTVLTEPERMKLIEERKRIKALNAAGPKTIEVAAERLLPKNEPDPAETDETA